MLKDSQGLKSYGYNDSCAFYLLAVVLMLLCQGIVGLVLAALSGTYPELKSNGDFNTAFMIFMQVANAAFIYFYTRIRRYKFNFTFVHRDGDGQGVTPAVILVPIAGAAVLMAGMYLPTVWYGYLVHAMGLPESFGNIDLTTVSSVVMIVIASVILAPVMEETIYRGVLFHGLKRERPLISAALLSALSFMLMHMNPVQVMFQFAIGTVCAFVVHRSGRLLPSIILHAAANVIALVIQLTPLGVALDGCVVWLTQNITAAVFITLGLFAAGGGLLFVLVHFCFGKYEPPVEEEADNAVAATRRKLGRSDGTFKYFAAIGICAVMLIVNLITGILS